MFKVPSIGYKRQILFWHPSKPVRFTVQELILLHASGSQTVFAQVKNFDQPKGC